jgi:uncharacterized protein YeaO (DUF488 family)
MIEDELIKSFKRIPMAERVALFEMFSRHPELFASFQRRFFEKLKALRSHSKEEIDKIFQEEKEEVLKLIKEI